MPPTAPTAGGLSTRRNAKRASTSNNESSSRIKRVKTEKTAEEEDDAEEIQNGSVLPTSKQLLYGIFEERIHLRRCGKELEHTWDS